MRGVHGPTGTHRHLYLQRPVINMSRCTLTLPLCLAVRVQPEVKWKLSNAETYSKMRLKLVPNYNYDAHCEASALRDNMGMKQTFSKSYLRLLELFCKAK